MRDELAELDTGLSNPATWLEIADRGKNGSIKLTDLDTAAEARNMSCPLKSDVVIR